MLTGGVLAGGVLAGGVLAGAVLAGGVLSGGVLSGGVLSGGVLSGGVLSGGVLSGGVVSAGVVSAGVVSAGVVSAGVLEPPGDVVPAGAVVPLSIPGICAAVRTSEVAGGDPQIALAVLALAVVAARIAVPVKNIPIPKNAMPMTTPSAAGFRSIALNGCNLASVTCPRHAVAALLVDFRHTTHALHGDSSCRGLATKGS